MGKQYLLDCTLRDGGYVNDWNFGQDSIAYIFDRLVLSGVDVIEVGFIDERRAYDYNRTIMPGTEAVEKNFGGYNRGKAMLVGMIDYGTCGIEHIQPCSESCLDGIRVIFKKEVMYPAMEFCKQVKALGYKVFSQLVSVTSYSDDELREVIGLVNDCHPYAVSMVDTYGLCDEPTLAHIISVIDEVLDPDIVLGYHAHNNFQLGYSNTISVLNHGLKRDILVDGTLYGMGKSAGNAPLELIAMYMNSNFNKSYDLNQIQEAITNCILDIYQKKPWGYTLFYYIAASNRCHPDYVSYLMNKRTLSITAVNEILHQIPEEKKLGKDKKMIEELYCAYQSKERNKEQGLKDLRRKLAEKPILVLGPGSSMEKQSLKIDEYIRTYDPIVVSINYIPQKFDAQYIFLTNIRRYLQMNSRISHLGSVCPPVIATSNITCAGAEGFAYVVNYQDLIDTEAEFQDNSMIMLIKLLMRLDVKKVALAGFDGYTPDNLNYYDSHMEYSFVREKAESLNAYAKNFFRDHRDQIEIEFVTTSYYQ